LLAVSPDFFAGSGAVDPRNDLGSNGVGRSFATNLCDYMSKVVVA
jgi:hypothetical protein